LRREVEGANRDVDDRELDDAEEQEQKERQDERKFEQSLATLRRARPSWPHHQFLLTVDGGISYVSPEARDEILLWLRRRVTLLESRRSYV
jgi:hypothetical protein